MVFIDLENTYDRVPKNATWKILKAKMGPKVIY